jgi:hypothetical protein
LGFYLAAGIHLASAAFSLSWAIHNWSEVVKMQWQYKSIRCPSNKGSNAEQEMLLKSMGEESWELVSAHWFDQGKYFRMFFKRPKPSDAPYR